MPSIIANTVGTQRQFTKQPGATYQRNLVGVRDSSTVINGERAAYLANALVDFSSSIYALYGDRDKRQQIYAQATSDLINNQTDDDWMKLSTMDILNKSVLGDKLVNNPYAIALVDEGRGKYMKAKADTEYQTLIAQQGYAGNAAAENKRYEGFINNYFKENAGVADNEVAFSRGFYSTFQEDKQTNWNAAELRKNTDMKAQADASIQTQLKEAVHNIQLDPNPDTVEERLAPIFKSFVVAAWDSPTRITATRSFITDLTNAGIPEETLDRILASKIYPPRTEYGETEPISIGTIVGVENTQHDNHLSNIKNGSEEYWNVRSRWAGMTAAQMKDDYDKMSPEQHLDYTATFNSLYNSKLTSETRQAKKAKIAQMKQGNVMNVSNSVRELCMRIRSDDTSVPTALSDWEVTEVNPVTGVVKERSLTDAELWQGVNQYIAEDVLMDDSLSSEEKATTTMRILNSKIMSKISNRYEDVASNALLTIKPAASESDPDYKTVQMCCDMVRANPGLAAGILGDSYGDYAALVALSRVGNGETSGLSRYYAYRNLSDEDSKALRYDVDNYAKGRTIKVEDLDGDSSTVSVTDPFLKQYYEKFCMACRASGFSQQQADEQFKSTFSDNWTCWKGNLIPKAIFTGINAGDETGVGFQYMQYELQKYADDNQENLDNLSWTYSHYNGHMMLTSLSTGRVYVNMTPDEFVADCNTVMEQRYQEQQNEESQLNPAIRNSPLAMMIYNWVK